MSRLWALLRGATLADAFVAVSLLTLLAVLLYPAWSARAFRERVSAAITDVDAVASAARQSRTALGRWPSAASAGEPPPELSGLGGGPFARVAYTLSWTLWQVVDSVPAPPDPGPPPAPGDAPRATAPPLMLPVTRQVGAVSVRSNESALLAALLRHFGSDASFVLDSLWLLVLEEGPGAQAR
jgi:hypothetical protein